MKEGELTEKRARKRRFALVVIGLMAICSGGLSLLGGKLHYSNYWGAPVFAPFVVLVGFLSLVGAFFLSKR